MSATPYQYHHKITIFFKNPAEELYRRDPTQYARVPGGFEKSRSRRRRGEAETTAAGAAPKRQPGWHWLGCCARWTRPVAVGGAWCVALPCEAAWQLAAVRTPALLGRGSRTIDDTSMAVPAMLCLQLCFSRQPHWCLIGWLVTVAALALTTVLWVRHAAWLLGISPPRACPHPYGHTHQHQPAVATKTFRLNAHRSDGTKFGGWHVRSAPNLLAKPVAQLRHGDEVEVTEVRVGAERAQGDWLLLADGRGWLRKEHDGAAWLLVDERGLVVPDRWSAMSSKQNAGTVRVDLSTSRAPITSTPVPIGARVPAQERGGAAPSLSLSDAPRDEAAAAPPRPLPPFTYCSQTQSLATDAANYAPGFLSSSSWEVSPSPVPSAITWRMPSSPVLGSPIRPFKARGIVEGVEPAVLAAMFLGLALKWPERNHQVKRRKQEVRRVERVDWSTTVWFEHEKIPVPFVADRESLYLETFRHCVTGSNENDESFMIVRKSVDNVDIPVAPGRVRGLSYVVMSFRRDPEGKGTEQTLAMDFDIKGRLPGRAVDGFLAQQAALFDKLTKFVGSKVRSVAICPPLFILVCPAVLRLPMYPYPQPITFDINQRQRRGHV